MIAASVGPYRVIEKLGAGGMGEVYLAEDTRLGRKVALKTISSQVTRDARERLLHEARAAATLNHANIAAIYDVLEEGAEIYIVMEFVDGATLASRLRYGPMLPDEALEIAAQVLDALDHAHAHGVVHRDLKPANISLAAGRKVKILDFGIARLHQAVVRDTRAGTTEAGRVFGTPGYSAPEQLLGRVGDERSDLYGVGVLLFELMAGRPPFEATDLMGAAMASLGEPPRLSAVAPNVPQAFSDLVAKAMAPDPDRRFQSASEMLAALRALTPEISDHPTWDGIDAPAVRVPARRRWLRDFAVGSVAVALMVLAGMPLARYWRTAPRAGEMARLPIIAVLPLENLGRDPSDESIGAGIAETLSMALSKIDSLAVLSRAEVVEAVRRGRDPRRLAGDLGASYLVDGSVQQSGGHLRVILRLVDPDGGMTWSESYDDRTEAVFALQRTIAADLVQILQGAISAATRAELITASTTNVDALMAYWNGRSVLDGAASAAAVAEAVGNFQRAVQLDPSFSLAYAGLADAYWRQYLESHDAALTRRALDAGLTALRLDAKQPLVRVALANVYEGMGKYDDAIRELRAVLAQQPSNDEAKRVLARVLMSEGRGEEAVTALKDAVAVRPAHWRNYYELGLLQYRLRRLPDAAASFQHALDLRPNDPRIHTNLGSVLEQMGDRPRALENFERANTLLPSRRGFSNIGTIYYRLGRFADAALAYQAALKLDAAYPVTHGNLGDTFLRLGREADAKREFQAARQLSLSALQVNEKDAPALARLGVFEAKLGMCESATARVRQAVSLARDDPEIHYKAAVVDVRCGRRDAALGPLARALQLGYSAQEARKDYDLAPLKDSAKFTALVGPHD